MMNLEQRVRLALRDALLAAVRDALRDDPSLTDAEIAQATDDALWRLFESSEGQALVCRAAAYYRKGIFDV